MGQGSLRRNVLFSGISNLSNMLIFALMILASRKLGREPFGIFCFAQALVLMHLTLMNFGLNQMMVHDIARAQDQASRYLFNVICWKGVLAGSALAVLAVNVIYFMELGGTERLTIALVALAVMFRYFSMTARCVFRAFEWFDRESVLVFAEQVVLLLLGTGALLAGQGMVGLAVAFVVSRAIGCVLSFAYVLRLVPWRMQFDARLIRSIQAKAIPIGLGMFVTTAYLHVDTLILKGMSGFGDVGLYNTALKVFMGLLILPSIICQVWLPRLSTSFENDKHGHNSILVKGMLALLGASLLVAIVGIPLARPMMRMVFGSEYLDATVTMQILFGVCLFTFQNWFLRILLIAIDRRLALLVFSLIGLVLRITLDLLLIPRWGIEGAAIAMGLSELLVCVGIWVYLMRRHFRIQGFGDLLNKVKIASMTESVG